MKNEEYKKLSIKEFTKAAERYESDYAGIYKMCKKDYPDILEELAKEPFRETRLDVENAVVEWKSAERQIKIDRRWKCGI